MEKRLTSPLKYLLIALLSGHFSLQAQTYLDAKTAIAAGEDIRLYANLADSPLYPYLAADFYRNHLDRTDEVTPLFKRHYSAPPIKRLHNQWLKNRFDNGDFDAITMHYYDTGSQTAECIYRQAQLLSGNRQAALKQIEHLWLSPKSVSDYCSPVFAVWDKKDNPDYLIKRAKLAYHAGNADFAARMAGKAGGTTSAVLLQFARYVKSPTLLLSASASDLTATPLHRELLPLALEKLVRKDSVRYAAFAMQFTPQLQQNADYQAMLAKLTGYLANRQDAQAEQSYALLEKPNKNATESLLRYLVGVKDWQAVSRLISANNNNSMALYWLGRATEAQGKNADTIYRKAAATRSYYGFLAADKLGQAYQFNAEPIQPEAKAQRNFNQNSGLTRGKLLYQYGDAVAARKEILPLAARMSPQSARQLAYWLNRNGFHHDAIYVLGKIRDWNDIDIRFPTPYNSQVEAARQLTQVDPTWIYAIIRQESSMNPRAVSRARAKGLMQLIPSTARRMANNLGISLYGNAIFDADVNTRLGAQYLSKMYRRFGNLALASAAYNAGPGRVDRWTANGIDDMPIWIEKIPFNETRKYVKRIMEYQQVYARHLNQKIPTVTEILAQGTTQFNHRTGKAQ